MPSSRGLFLFSNSPNNPLPNMYDATVNRQLHHFFNKQHILFLIREKNVNSQQ